MTGTRDDLIERIKQNYKADDFMLIEIWSPVDVMACDRNISESQACDILTDINSNFDANIGVNWEVINAYINKEG
jgi:hypothetical protein